MCGIVGLFLKDASLEPKLGAMLADMLVTMTDRGPDSAGIAIYSGAGEGRAKLTVQSAHPGRDFANLDADLKDAILAMLRHYREDRDFMYGLDIKFLDEARAARR